MPTRAVDVTKKPIGQGVSAATRLCLRLDSHIAFDVGFVGYNDVPPHKDDNTAYPLPILRFPPTQTTTPFPNCGTGIILDNHPM